MIAMLHKKLSNYSVKYNYLQRKNMVRFSKDHSHFYSSLTLTKSSSTSVLVNQKVNNPDK